MPRSRRHFLRSFVFLSLGLISTIAAAWACAFIPAQTGGTLRSAYQRWRPPGSTAVGWRGIDSWDHFGAVRYACVILNPGEDNSVTPGSIRDGEIASIAPRWSRETLVGWTDSLTDWPRDSLPIVGVDARGLPFPALWCSYGREQITEPDHWCWKDGGIQLSEGLMPPIEADWYPRAALPCRPIWTGLLIDTGIFSAAWWGLLALPQSLIRRSRLRRNHCPHCNYDLRATPADALCPECGRTRS